MKKTRIIGALLAGLMAVSAPAVLPADQSPFIVNADAASLLAAPAAVKATTADKSIKLTWSAVKGADAYRVFKYNAATDKFETYKNVSGTTCKVTGLSAGKTYRFRVAALVKSGSDYKVQDKSAVKSVSTKLAAPKNITAEINGSNVTLSWKKVSGASAYRIYMRKGTSGDYSVYKNVSSTSCKVTGLSSGKYQFRIAALVKKSSGYKEQTKSDAITVNAKGSSSSSTSANIPITFPAFGTKKSAVISKMNLSNGLDVGEIQDGVYGYGGYKKVNGQETMVLLYFDNKDRFFCGTAIFEEAAISSSKLHSALKSAYGKELFNMDIAGSNIYGWSDADNGNTTAVVDISGQGSMYIYVNTLLMPDSMRKNNNSLGGFDISSLI